jgi:Family of unknown function (DUF5329)
VQVVVRLLTLLLPWLLASAAIGAPLATAVRTETDALLERLETSGCEFNRNGTWYPAPEAKPHLQRKLGYLEDRSMVQTTEQFIERAASGSSMSGQPYFIRCGTGRILQSLHLVRSTRLANVYRAPRGAV